MSRSKDERKKQNKKRKNDLAARKTNAYRTKAGLKFDEEEAVLASHFRRACAFAIDQLIFLLMFFGYVFVLAVLFNGIPKFASNLLIPSLIFGLAYVAPSIGLKGATFGCRKCGIIVIDENGKGLIGFQRAFNRWFLLNGIVTIATVVFSIYVSERYQTIAGILSGSVSLIFYLPAFWDTNRQGFHDRLCDSVVIKALPSGLGRK